MIQILDTSGCSSVAVGVVLGAFQKILRLIQIIGPILLIVSISLNVFKLLSNPEDKKIPKKILNSVVAAVLLFFIPMFVDLVMNLMGNNFSISACWKSVKVPSSGTPSYIDPYNQGKKKQINPDSKDYEKGKKYVAPTGAQKIEGGNLTYYVYLPPNASSGLPLLVWMHGDGSGAPTSNTLGETAKAAGYPAIVVQPYSPNLGTSSNPGWWEAGHLGEVKKIVDKVCSQYNCNTRNINVGGHSRGAIGAWMMVSSYPNFFHAAAPISCCSKRGFRPESFKGMKVWAMRGSGAGSGNGNDDIYGSCMASSVNSVKKYAKEVKYTILPGVTHGGAGSNAASNKDMMKFIFSN